MSFKYLLFTLCFMQLYRNGRMSDRGSKKEIKNKSL